MRKKPSSKKMGLGFERIVAKMLTKHTSYNVESKTIGSGCFWHSKGDLIVSKGRRDYVLEIKGTNKDCYRLSAKTISKIWDEALESCKLGLFAVLIEGKNERKLCIMEIGIYYADKKAPKTVLLDSEFFDRIESNSTMFIQNEGKLWLLNCTVVKEDK